MELDKFSTHRKFLEHYVKKTTGDILEFGCGYGSTPLIMELIKGTGRKLYTYESDLVWMKKMEQEIPANDQHEYIFSPNWKNTLKFLSQRHKNAGVVFIDQSPWKARHDTFLEFKEQADYILIHDVDWFPKNGMFGTVRGELDFDFSDISDNWKLYYPDVMASATGPPTLVVGKVGMTLDEL